VQAVRNSQRCIWGSLSSGMWLCSMGYLFAITFILKVKVQRWK